MSGRLHIGTKLVSLEPMTRQEYNDFRGWMLPADENGADEGYLVEYKDGGAPNVPGRDGYVSWSPKEVAERAYRPTTAMSFGLAIEALKLGERVARKGWNGKGMFLFYVRAFDYDLYARESVSPHVLGMLKLPWIGMKTADNGLVPWLASQTDMLADDWELLP